jgi:hypothetical protein
MLETSGVGRAGFRGWRARRIVGAEGARSPAWSQAGRSPRPEIAEPARRAERAEPELVKARKLIEIHGNLAALSEQMLGTEGASGSDNRADGRGADADHRHSPGVPGGGRVCDDVLSPAAAAGASASSAAAKAGESGFSRCILGWAVQYLGITKHTRGRTSRATTAPLLRVEHQTLEYRLGFPARFDDIAHARGHCNVFHDWYNQADRHSGIGLMSPGAFHHGQPLTKCEHEPSHRG